MVDHATIMTQAAMLRRQLGEDDASPIDVFALALSMDGLTLVFYPMGNNLSGMCVKGQSGNKLVSINSGMTLGRQRFSMAHELYHLRYDASMKSLCYKSIGSGSDVEKAADAFASYFLMPAIALEQMAGKLCGSHADGRLQLDDIIRIEQYFRVSHQAAVYRLMGTRYLDKRTGKLFLGQPVRARAERMGYGPELYRSKPQAERYMTYGSNVRQIEEALSKNLISYGKYEELLLDAFRADLVYGAEDEAGDVID